MRTSRLRGAGSALVAALVLAAAGASSSRASLVPPDVVPDNPSCGDLGYALGFKIEPPSSGTYTFPGGTHTVTISTDGTFFDWSATLGIDAVLVKGGPDTNAYQYELHLGHEVMADSGLHSPDNFGAVRCPALSHIEFCYDLEQDYELTIAKTATTTYRRTWNWSIDKAVVPESWMMFTGETGTSNYTVTVTRTGSTDSNWAVSGVITIVNPAPVAATLVGVTDLVSGGITPEVSCGVSFPYALAAGATLECTYASPLPDGRARLNTATVTTTGPVEGGTAQAEVLFGEPTTVANAEVDVVDTNGGSWHFAGTGSVGYARTFACDGDEGGHANTATIVQTGQSDSANVVVACDEVGLRKTADPPTLRRTWRWSIVKTGDQTHLVLDPGQPFLVNYTVTVRATALDSDWRATGEIVITNATSMSAHLAEIRDAIPGASPIVPDCGGAIPGFVPPGGVVVCSWDARLGSGANVLNTVYLTRTNFAWSSTGEATPIGSTALEASALVDFSQAERTETDECVDVSDVFDGDPPVELGTVCAEQSPYSHTFTFEMTFRYLKLEICSFQEHNVASFVTNDTGATGRDDHTILVDVHCLCGCTLSPRYWATHTKRGPLPYDEDWKLVGNLEESTEFFLAAKDWYTVLWAPAESHPYYLLARDWIAADLNSLDGSWLPPEIEYAMNEAEALFATYTPDEVLSGSKGVYVRMLQLAGLIRMYNEGDLGPGRCTEEGVTSR
jgi:hypothetical protein